MAYATIELEHPQSGRVKKAPYGFSWTTLFFGIFPALFREDWKWAGIIFGVYILAGWTVVLLPVVWIAGGLLYNKKHLEELFNQGYKIRAIKPDSAPLDVPMIATDIGYTTEKLKENYVKDRSKF